MSMPALEPTVEQWKLHMGHDRIKQEWTEIPDRMRRRWRKLTWDDVLFAGGSAEYLARVLQDRYGVDRREAMLQVYEFESGL
ncbi:MAG TPA: CsbD family protein [Rhodanobacteraceae bacterium]|nr:CsbD family protein [Rhodanobacteraceae bacterium]